MKFEFAGVSGVIDEGVKSKWHEPMEYYLETEDVYEHVEEGLSHKYRYAIQISDGIEVDSKAVIAYYVVDKESLSTKVVKEILRSNYDDINSFDLVTVGLAVEIGYKECHEDEEEFTILEAINSIESINGLKGFYLDKAWNGIGTTGWDVIEYVLGNKEELFNF